MARRVLVLNQDYSPITVCTVYKGFLMVYLNKAELIIAYEDLRLQSIENSFAAPAVIRVSRYINVPFKGVLLNRHNLFRRDAKTCQYCGSKNDLTIDHVLPRSRGGKTSWTNLVTACKKCNNRKGDFMPDEAGMPLIRQPYKPGFGIFLRDMEGGYCPEWEPFLIRKSVEH
jgi:hypothetical protein